MVFKKVPGWIIVLLVAVARFVSAGETEQARVAAQSLTEVSAVLEQAQTGAKEMPSIAGKELSAEAGLPVIWGTVEKQNGQVRLPADPSEVVSAYNWSKGFFRRHDYVTYILKVAPESLPRFTASGFKRTDEIQIRLVWGRYTSEGYQQRGWTENLTFTGPKLERGFQLMRDVHTDSLEVLRRYPEAQAWVRAPVRFWDSSYFIQTSLEIRTGHTWTDTETLLYEYGSRSGYFSK